jgi:tetratricopeptide (TPR) repeat protein
MMLMFRGLVLLVPLLLAGGCTLLEAERSGPVPLELPESDGSAPPPAPQPPATPSQPIQPPPEPNATEAYGALLDRALMAREAGDYDQALSLLERALRIDPDSGELYLELSRTYRLQGNMAQSRATAERGLLYCAGAECGLLRRMLD